MGSCLCSYVLQLFVFLVEVPWELGPLSFHKLCACVDVHVDKTKFERNCSIDYMTQCTGKTKLTS